jgi:hypothetical protein
VGAKVLKTPVWAGKGWLAALFYEYWKFIRPHTPEPSFTPHD